MKIFKPLCLLLCLFLFNHIQSQQSYKSGHYATPGTMYLYNRLTGLPPQQTITQAGAGITWDLTSNTELNTHLTEMVFPSQVIDQFTFFTICGLGGNSTLECITIWGNTQQALLSQDSLDLFGFSLQDLQRFQRKTNSYLLENFFGFNVDLGGLPTQAVIVYNDPDTILQFPVEYGNSWNSNIGWSIDLSITGQNIMYKSEQSRSAEVDAWGTIMTPYDTFKNVIRLRSEVVHVDTLYTDTINLPVNITQVEYLWFDTLYRLPVMIANGVVTDTAEIITVVEYIYEDTCDAPTWDLVIAADTFFTDVNGEVTVFFEITNSNANTYDWDFGDGTFETTEGSVSHTFTVAGNYSVGVTGCMTHCLPLNSCTSDIIDFEILTSIDAVPGEEIGITLFPNPVSDLLTVRMPSGFQGYEVFIIDIHGRLVHSALSITDQISFDCKALPEGVYTLLVRDPAYQSHQQYYLRFVHVTHK
jgi:hypothetical protein